ncbi:MAG TPA: type IV toxin-antitoxin system AbiEi family antitoxin domain-containing protein [Jiangellaceae bacterium]
MDVATAITMLGGTARWIELREHVSQRALERAVRDKEIVRIGRGVYRLPSLPEPESVPPGVYSHVTAAEVWELGVLHQTEITHVTVPKSTKVREIPKNTKVHYADLLPDATDGRTTRPLQTVLDCSRTCRFDEALAIADTAVRVRMVTKPVLIEAAAKLRGPGSRQARRIAALCDERSHSPLESALRALLIEAGLIFFEPQYAAKAASGEVLARVDLGDPVTGVLLEADSFLFHGHRGQLEWDARRYTVLVAHGFLVLRFAYEHVLGDKDWVVETVKRTLVLRGRVAV